MMKCCQLLWIFSYLVFERFGVASGKNIPAMFFQVDEIPTAYSWAKYTGNFPEMKSISICMYFNVLRGRTSYDTLFSYATINNMNEIYIGYTPPDAELEIWKNMGILAHTQYKFQILSWVRVCYVQSSEQRKYKFWINDAYEETFAEEPVPLTVGGGIFFLGQDQDEYGGGFSTDQSFHGYIADLQVFNRTISDDEAESYVQCNSQFSSTPTIDFSAIESDWLLNSTVQVTTLPQEEICAPEKTFYLMFPEKRAYEPSAQLCHNFKSRIPLPKNQKENDALFPLLAEYIKECRDGNGNMAWLAVSMIVENETNLDAYQGTPVTYSNYGADVFIPGYECSSMIHMNNYQRGLWFSARCVDEQICVVCQFSTITRIKTRGLCSQSIFDRLYLVYGYKKKKPHIRGHYFSDIRWNGKTWYLEYLDNRQINGTMIMNTPFDYPLGKKKWIMRGDFCSSENTMNTHLVFTTCNETQFTCDDGSCVHIKQRCDLLLNCPDQSDEFDCNIIRVPASYISVLPPPEKDGSSVSVVVDMVVSSIRSFSLIDLTLSYDLTINLEWRDSRLTYQNLKENLDQNQVTIANVKEIWIPSFFLEDESGSKVSVIDHGFQTFVSRDTEPLPDDNQRLKEDQLYEGMSNALYQKRIMTLSFLCQFDLSNYPFDIQTCKLVLRATQGEKSVQLKARDAEFLGERRLLEYQVDEVYSESTIVDGYSEVTFVITFFNLFKYYIFGTYVPTSLIVFITYMTFYFGLKDFTNRIMVSLTALMVLAALFLQTSQGVARTAYMKLVDMWFLFCMVFNFVIILILVVINFILENYDTVGQSPTFKVFPIKEGGSPDSLTRKEAFAEKLSRNFTASHVNRLFRIFFPILFLAITFSYIGYILSNWSIPSK